MNDLHSLNAAIPFDYQQKCLRVVVRLYVRMHPCQYQSINQSEFSKVAQVTELPQSHYMETNKLLLHNNVRIGLEEQMDFQWITQTDKSYVLR